MSQESLVDGLEFARKHNLTQKEIEILIPFLEKPLTAAQLAEKLGANKTTMHHIIQRLKLKNLLTLLERDNKGTNLYQFNVQQLGN